MKKDAPVVSFWRWFTRHEAELYEFEKDRERIFDQLSDRLRNVDADLMFEFGPKELPRELVISADGIKRAFPAVTSVVRSAPLLPRWRFTAFRPRRALPARVAFRNTEANSEDVSFTLMDNGKVAGVRLFLPNYQGGANWKTIGYLLLDHALGEFDVETKLGLIDMCSSTEVSDGIRHPFAQLPSQFDQLIARLESRSGQPS